MITIIRKIGVGLGLLIAAAMAVVALICLANPHRAALYLIDIFSVAILTGFVGLAASLAVLRQRAATGLAGVACVLMVAGVWPQAFPHQAPADKSRGAVRLVFANMLIRNTTPEKLLPWVRAQKPDIVAMVEADPRSRGLLLAGLQADLPYKVSRYDMMVLSRYPLGHLQPRPGGFALVTVDVATPQGPLHLAVAHLTRPWPFKPAEQQRRQFDRLARDLGRAAERDFVLVGDFNAPPLASGMGDFARATGLHAAPALRGTWPTFLPSMLRVTIDNALASPDIRFERRKVGGYDGSDHRPICVDIYRVKRVVGSAP